MLPKCRSNQGASAEWGNDDEARKLWEIRFSCITEALEKAKPTVRVAEENQGVVMTRYCDKMGTCKCGQEMSGFSRVDTGREPRIYSEYTGYDFCSDGATEAQWLQPEYNGPLMNNSHLWLSRVKYRDRATFV